MINYSAEQTPEAILSTELNSLSDGSNKLSAAFSNDAEATVNERLLYGMLSLNLAAQAAARDAGAFVSVYILAESDGSYTYGSDTLDPPLSARVGKFELDPSTAGRVVNLQGIPLPPTDFKVLVINMTGQNFAASGNTLTLTRYSVEDV